MKKITLILVFSVALISAHGQFNGFSISGGIGTYSMSGLSAYQDVLVARLPVEAKQFDYFPAYTNLRINLFKESGSGLNYGFVFAFSATGTHANYTDNSGALNLDQRVAAYQAGASVSYPLLVKGEINKGFELMAYGDLRLGYVRNNVSSLVNTSYYFESNALNLSAVSPMTELGVQALFHFDKISAGLEGGYLLDLNSKFSAGDQSAYDPSFSLMPSGDVRSGMSGFRIGLKIIFWISPSFSEELN